MRTTTRILAALAVLAIMATGASAQVTYEETSDRLFLRGSGCGATEDLYLAARQGGDEYDGCGAIGGLPANEAFGTTKTLTTRDTPTYIIDATRQLTVQIRAESWFGNGVPGAGQSVVELSLTGQRADGGFMPVQLGSATSEILVTGADNATHTMTIDIPDDAHEVELSSVTLQLQVRGANVNVNNIGMEGDSHLTLPTLEVVEG